MQIELIEGIDPITPMRASGADEKSLPTKAMIIKNPDDSLGHVSIDLGDDNKTKNGEWYYSDYYGDSQLKYSKEKGYKK